MYLCCLLLIIYITKFMKKFFFLLLLFVGLTAKANYWTPNPYQYQNNMTVVGVVSFNGVEQKSDMLEIGAFCEGECRGSVITQYEEVFDRSYVFLMIYGEYNDSITFRCYDHNRNMELEMIPESHLLFQANAMIGGVVDPFVFSFQSYKHNVSIELSPEATATVVGGGEYNQYDTCYVQITPNQGFQFDALTENGDTLTKQPNYSFIVMSDRNLVAHLSEMPIYYQVTAEITPDAAGTISGLGEYLEGETCTLQITPNSGYDYVGLYENDELVTTENSFTFDVNSDRHFKAEFLIQINYYQVSAEINPSEAGSISGLGAYQEGETCTLEMTANEGYTFVALKENDEVVSEENTYSFVVESDRHFSADFVLNEYTVTLSANPEEGGTLSGGGIYSHGSTAYAIAIPNENYSFKNWTKDGAIVSSNSQYVFEVTEPVELVAHFEYHDDVEEVTDNIMVVYPNPASDYIKVSGLVKKTGATIYDLTGKIILKKSLSLDDNKMDISDIHSGTYIMIIDNNSYKIIIN